MKWMARLSLNDTCYYQHEDKEQQLGDIVLNDRGQEIIFAVIQIEKMGMKEIKHYYTRT